MKASNENLDPAFGERKPLLFAQTQHGSSFRLDGDSEVLQSSASSQQSTNSKQPSPMVAGLNLLAKNRYTASGRPIRGKRGGNQLLPRKYSVKSKAFLLLCYLGAFVWTLCILFGPLVLHFQDKALWCPVYDPNADDEHLFTTVTNDDVTNRQLKSSGDAGSRSSRATADDRLNSEIPVEEREYENPDYDTDPCRYVRLPSLMGLTLEECDFCRRMLTAVLLGGTIGYERRSSDRPAGIRTLGLVSLGACFFTISSISAFKSSTMGWDSSRVTAALPSGVGFLGAALIWKGTVSIDGQDTHQVHGLTTAAGVWLSAAIGVGAGGALYFVSFYSTALILLVLRYGPKLYMQEDDASDDDDDEDDDDDDETEYNEAPSRRDQDVTKDKEQQYTQLLNDESAKSEALQDTSGGSAQVPAAKLKRSSIHHHKKNHTYYR
uniref:MgtC/SapB/SrpB/YhiD N-terminal domain-containing protein n=1 Tax=Grammatophora oceanica TaxID=210454 RepID=A0A7S1VRB7_9STRA|mmetsp:Transcript_52492/g.78434  ORF Transcript_52492/g.78434 Transcript_52492/m.78434 type:complete len:435 (+) Transcript_52492:120-1424(+)